VPAPRPPAATDEVLIDAARAHVRRLYGPGKSPRVITIHVEGVPDALSLPVPPCPPYTFQQPPEALPGREPFVPSEVQADVLEALEGKALKTAALAKAAGVSERDLFRHPGGLKELRDLGMVEHHSRAGYYRPECPPDGLPAA
jgi:hypothetical protein